MNIFHELYNYRELLKSMVKKDIRGRYKGSILGFMWAFLNPLLMLLVYAIVFSIVFRVEEDNYIMFLFVAVMPWSYFTSCISIGTPAILANGNILKKVYFPRVILPISIVTGGTINFLISLAITFIALIISGIWFSKYIILLPFVIIIQYLFTLGMVLILSALTVYARDLEYIVQVILMMWFYANPIIYRIDMIPAKYLSIYKLNPMASILTGYRDILYYKQLPDLIELGIIFVVSILLVIIGYKIFKKCERRFAEEI